MKLQDLYDAMSDAYKGDPKQYGHAHARLYDDHFTQAIQAEGFTLAQTKVIAYAAYERGHSAGCQEIVSVAMGICEFARALLDAR